MNLPHGWTYRDEAWAKKMADEGRSVEPQFDYQCECGVGHDFGDLPQAEIIEFLKGHEHGDRRLPPNHPTFEKRLTEAQWEDHLAGGGASGGPREARVYSERGRQA